LLYDDDDDVDESQPVIRKWNGLRQFKRRYTHNSHFNFNRLLPYIVISTSNAFNIILYVIFHYLNADSPINWHIRTTDRDQFEVFNIIKYLVTFHGSFEIINYEIIRFVCFERDCVCMCRSIGWRQMRARVHTLWRTQIVIIYRQAQTRHRI
jgi:hypothetical protein